MVDYYSNFVRDTWTVYKLQRRKKKRMFKKTNNLGQYMACNRLSAESI